VTDAAQRTWRKRAWLVLAWLVLATLVCNGLRDLIQPDEGRYAEIPRQMLARSDWVVPHLNGLPYVEKPPLQYWATALAYSVLGDHGWVSRLWTLLLGIAGVVAVYGAGRRLFGTTAAAGSALILMSAPLYLLVGQINLLDMGLTFFLTAALLCFVLAQRDEADALQRRRWMLLCWTAVGLGFLQKGLTAFAVPGIALLVYSGLRRDLALLGRLHLAGGIAVLAVLVLPWTVLLGLRDARFAEFFLIHEHFTRFLTNEHQRVQPFWYFGMVLVAGCLPWTVLMLRQAGMALRSSIRVGTPGAVRFDVPLALAVWAVTVVVFFSLSGSKLVPYIMPAVPPLALLAGRALAQRDAQGATGLGSVLPLALLLGVVMLIAQPVVLAVAKGGSLLPVYRAVGPVLTTGGLLVLAGTGFAWWMLRRGTGVLAAVLGLAVSLHLACLVLVTGGNSLAALRGAPGAAVQLQERLQPETPFYCVGTYLHVLAFDLRRDCILVEYTGELQVQFASGVPLSLSEFAARWSAASDAVALVDASFLPRMRAAQLPYKVLVEYRDHSIVVHP